MQASKVQEVAKKAAAVVATLPALVAASPAFALVSGRDTRQQARGACMHFRPRITEIRGD